MKKVTFTNGSTSVFITAINAKFFGNKAINIALLIADKNQTKGIITSDFVAFATISKASDVRGYHVTITPTYDTTIQIIDLK